MMWNNTTESGSVEDGVTNDHILTVTFFIEAFAIILANLLTIITFTINRHLRKRSMYFVINLAVADMLFGIEGSVSRALMWKMQGRIKWLDYLDQNFMLWRVVSINVMAAGTMLSLALVAVERMCATVWPVRHRNAKSWAYTLAIVMTWTMAAMNGLLLAILMSTMPSSGISNLVSGLGIVVVVGIICVSYIVIFIKVKPQQKQVTGQRVSRQDRRLAMTLFIMTMASFGTFIPLALVSLLTARDVIVVPYYVNVAVVLLAFSNSLVNPIIYVFRMKDFRKALLRLILKCSRDRPQPNHQQGALNTT